MLHDGRAIRLFRLNQVVEKSNHIPTRKSRGMSTLYLGEKPRDQSKSEKPREDNSQIIFKFK